MTNKLNPKPFHVELRANTDWQEVLIEDDVHQTEKGIVRYGKWYQRRYEALVLAPVDTILVITDNWTQETIYQDDKKAEYHTLQTTAYSDNVVSRQDTNIREIADFVMNFNWDEPMGKIQEEGRTTYRPFNESFPPGQNK